MFPQIRWQLRLRLVELLAEPYEVTPGPGTSSPHALAASSRPGSDSGFTIPPNVFGPGLKLPHWGTIVISPEAVVGRGCVVHPGVTLGVNHGRAPQLGDDVYLGPGAKIFGGLSIGDRVTVGANSVVTRDVPAGHPRGRRPRATHPWDWRCRPGTTPSCSAPGETRKSTGRNPTRA